jgi:hypothetical protein
MYYYKNIEMPLDETVRYIFFWITENSQINFADVESNTGQERMMYLAWLAEGNTPEEWQPETIEPASEPVIEETPADSTDEEPVTEDANLNRCCPDWWRCHTISDPD